MNTSLLFSVPLQSVSVQDAETFWPAKLEEIKGKADALNAESYTVQGRMLLLNSLILSKAAYCMDICPLRNEDIKSLERIYYNFLWGNKSKGMVDKRVCQLPKSLGGLGAKDIELWARRKATMWTKKYYMEPQGLWQQMLKNLFADLRLEKGPRDIGADPFLQKVESLDSLPKPWPWIIKAWKSLGGGTRRPQSRNELLAHPFWSNKAINAEQALSRVRRGALVRNSSPKNFSNL